MEWTTSSAEAVLFLWVVHEEEELYSVLCTFLLNSELNPNGIVMVIIIMIQLISVHLWDNRHLLSIQKLSVTIAPNSEHVNCFAPSSDVEHHRNHLLINNGFVS